MTIPCKKCRKTCRITVKFLSEIQAMMVSEEVIQTNVHFIIPLLIHISIFRKAMKAIGKVIMWFKVLWLLYFVHPGVCKCDLR